MLLSDYSFIFFSTSIVTTFFAKCSSSRTKSRFACSLQLAIYTFKHAFSLSTFAVLWEIFKDFKKIIEAITSNTKMHFNTIEKCKSLLQGLKAFSFYLTRKLHGLGPKVILKVRNIIVNKFVWSWHIHKRRSKEREKVQNNKIILKKECLILSSLFGLSCGSQKYMPTSSPIESVNMTLLGMEFLLAIFPSWGTTFFIPCKLVKNRIFNIKCTLCLKKYLKNKLLILVFCILPFTSIFLL